MDLKSHQKITHCEYACCEHAPDDRVLCERYYISGWGGSPDDSSRWICHDCYDAEHGFHHVYAFSCRWHLCPECKTHLPSELFEAGDDTREKVDADLEALVAEEPCEDCTEALDEADDFYWQSTGI